jgi:hypothetical protein
MSNIVTVGAVRDTRGRTIWALALVVAAMCLALVAGPGSAVAAVRPGAQPAPSGVLATISTGQTSTTVSPRVGARALGGYGWQTVTAANLSVRSTPGGSSIGTLFYGDQFYTASISGSWCYGDGYYDNGAGYTYYNTGWVLCDYLTKN